MQYADLKFGTSVLCWFVDKNKDNVHRGNTTIQILYVINNKAKCHFHLLTKFMGSQNPDASYNWPPKLDPIIMAAQKASS